MSFSEIWAKLHVSCGFGPLCVCLVTHGRMQNVGETMGERREAQVPPMWLVFQLNHTLCAIYIFENKVSIGAQWKHLKQ